MACGCSAGPASALATLAQLGAWGLQWLSCWLLLMALGLDSQAGVAAPQPSCSPSTSPPWSPPRPPTSASSRPPAWRSRRRLRRLVADAIAYGIVLQAVEVATALLMGVPALLNEGLSWRELRLRTIHAAPVKLGPPPADRAGALARAEG